MANRDRQRRYRASNPDKAREALRRFREENKTYSVSIPREEIPNLEQLIGKSPVTAKDIRDWLLEQCRSDESLPE